MTRPRMRVVATIAFFSLLIAACSGSDDSNASGKPAAPTKAELRSEIADEIETDCGILANLPGEDPTDPSWGSAYLDFAPRWRSVGATRSRMLTKIQQCARPKYEAEAAARAAREAAAEAERQRVAAEAAAEAERQRQAQEAAINNAPFVSVDAIVKNPDAVKGQYFRLYSKITQYDAATGACLFRGSWDSRSHQYNFEYEGDNAVFRSGTGSDCPVLNGVDEDDTVQLWVQSAGSYSYDTQAGGNTTVPLFEVLRAQIVRKE